MKLSLTSDHIALYFWLSHVWNSYPVIYIAVEQIITSEQFTELYYYLRQTLKQSKR